MDYSVFTGLLSETSNMFASTRGNAWVLTATARHAVPQPMEQHTLGRLWRYDQCDRQKMTKSCLERILVKVDCNGLTGKNLYYTGAYEGIDKRNIQKPCVIRELLVWCNCLFRVFWHD